MVWAIRCLIAPCREMETVQRRLEMVRVVLGGNCCSAGRYLAKRNANGSQSLSGSNLLATGFAAGLVV
jgi:hypothetical protein